MRNEILRFIRKICRELGLSANYVVPKNMYVIHKRGYAIQNFTPNQFYEISPSARRKLILGILKRGLTHNIGESRLRDNLFVNSQFGKRICQ